MTSKLKVQVTQEQAERLIRFLSESSHCCEDDLAHQPDCLLCQVAELLTKALDHD